MLPKIGRPPTTLEEIENLLDDNGLYILDDMEESDKPSKLQIHYSCEDGHESTSRLDTIKSWINLYDQNKRRAVCQDCNNELNELNNLIINENLVTEKGFSLNKMYNNTRGDLIYDIKCDNDHITIGRSKSSFTRSFTCIECKKTAGEYNCSFCKKILPLNEFNKCETNIYRNKTDHHCKKCREIQRQTRKDAGYKLPSRETIIENEIPGKVCVTKDCGFHPYSKYWSDTNNTDKYDKHCKECKAIINKKYQDNNKEKLKESSKEYRINHIDQITLMRNEWKKK